MATQRSFGCESPDRLRDNLLAENVPQIKLIRIYVIGIVDA